MVEQPVYCVRCKVPLDASDTFCKSCGADQRPPSMQAAASSPSPPIAPAPVLTTQAHPHADAILSEMVRQYRGLTWLQFAGIFLVPAYLIGLAMIIYAMVQKPAFRRKVAELGYDPETWEAPLRAEATRIMLAGVFVVVLAILVGLLINQVMLERVAKPSLSTSYSR